MYYVKIYPHFVCVSISDNQWHSSPQSVSEGATLSSWVFVVWPLIWRSSFLLPVYIWIKQLLCICFSLWLAHCNFCYFCYLWPQSLICKNETSWNRMNLLNVHVFNLRTGFEFVSQNTFRSPVCKIDQSNVITDLSTSSLITSQV